MNHLKNLNFQPVVLGTDIGTYTLARAFNEGWGVKPVVITTRELGPIQNSRIVDVRIVPADVREDNEVSPLIQGLVDMGPSLKAEFGDRKLLLIANMDSNIWDIAKNKDAIAEYYTCIFPDLGLLDLTNDKVKFPELAARFGLRVPTTISFDTHDGYEICANVLDEFSEPFPWIIKPASANGYERLRWPGKAKVYTAHSLEDAKQILSSLCEHTGNVEGVGSFVVQPRVEGNDSYNLSVTAYVDRNSKVTMLGSAQVLLEDHSPTALGNPSAMITEPYPALYEAVEKFLTGISWHGFANFDFKVDSRSGEILLFEMNPRIGRNSYYNTASGMNPMSFYVADMVDELSLDQQRMTRRIYYSVLPKLLVLQYVDDATGAKIREAYRRGKAFDPMCNPAEWDKPSVRGLKRFGYVVAARLNHFKKFRAFYPPAKHATLGTETFDTTELTKY